MFTTAYKAMKIPENSRWPEILAQIQALSSNKSFNSLRVGSPDRIMSIRKKNPNSPLAL